ncbi:hypothetical protein NQ318_008677 [Aromia moschata]|uniref:Uncharacterized protein n=1 Tax=Aromia moschata TaxID=1265417 RepID=A0AAV8XJD2_9CUCU|nr:hypothetical protein NQ318_008677 [Aromia moschata]
MAMAVTNKFIEFCPESDEWQIYDERLAQHFEANKITDAKTKTAVLLIYGERGKKFYELKQVDETVSEWHAIVRNLSVNCKFGNDLTKILKDKFVTGMKPGKMFDRLCEEEDSKRLEELVIIAQKVENMKKINFMNISNYPPKNVTGQDRKRPLPWQCASQNLWTLSNKRAPPGPK